VVAVVAVCKRIALCAMLAGYCSSVFRGWGGETFACCDIIEENGSSPGFHGLRIVT
jgi:hypothetical protein